MNQNNTLSSGRTAGLDIERRRAVAAALFAIVLGTFLIVGVGLAQPDMLHNAAHDSRHTLGFPCH
jgi:cobalt transporter subunit CbtB